MFKQDRWYFMLVSESLSMRYSLGPGERRQLRALAEELARLRIQEDIGLRVLADRTPLRLRQVLGEFATTSAQEGYLLIEGVDVGEIPPTPNDHQTEGRDGHVTSGVLTLVAESLGMLMGYSDEKRGALVHDVMPVRGEETRKENCGSVAFEFHTENVHHPLRPDYVALLCLRQDHDAVGATRIASIRQAHELLTARQVAALRRPEFRSLYPTSFTRNQRCDTPRSAPHRVVFGPADAPYLRFNSHNTKALTGEGDKALTALVEALEEVCVDMVLQPGQLVVLDNHVAAHGRCGFAPRYDGRDRWLRRCYATTSLPHWVRAMMPRPRVLPVVDDIVGVF
jgi:L-asparagine oxygenase